MSSTNRTQIRYIKETKWGELPVSGSMQDVRNTGDSLTFGLSTTQSNEIRSDRQITDLILTGAEAGGDIEMEFSAGNADDFMAAALYSNWVDIFLQDLTDIELVAPGKVKSTSTNFVDAGFKKGMRFLIADMDNQEAFELKILDVSEHEIQVQGPELPNRAAGGPFAITSATLENGITETSFSVERELADVSKYFLFLGMVPNQWTMNVAANEVITETFTFVGKDSVLDDMPHSPEPVLPAPTEPVMNAVTDVAKITISGVTTEIIVRSLDFTVNNNVRGLEAVSYLGAADLAEGDFLCTGSLEAYFQSGELYQKFLNSEEVAIELEFSRNGIKYSFDWPRVKIASDEVTVPGRNDDVMENIEWQALYDSASGYTMKITRLLNPLIHQKGE